MINIFRKSLAWLLLLGVALACCAHAETVTGDLEARFGNVSTIEYDGCSYKLRKRLTAVLLAGTDMRQDSKIVDNYMSGGQADFILLLVIDDNRNTIQPIHIDRDTMTEITILNVVGMEVGTRTAQVCLAHSFGDGKELSCEQLVNAVRRCLLDVPIDHYAVMNLDGIAAFNDLLGGIELTLEDDFSAYDPEMTPGKTIRLTGEQAEIYVRQRYFVGEQTNASRMLRQQNYMKAAAQELRNRVSENGGFISSLFEELDAYMVTDMSRGRILNLSNQAVQYELLPMIELEGELTKGEGGFMEFYPSDESVMQIVLDAFYAPEEG